MRVESLVLAGLAIATLASASPVLAQEGYIEVSGVADFSYGEGDDLVVLTNQIFTLGAYTPYADYDAGSNSFSGQTFFLGIQDLWAIGETWILGSLSVSSPPRVAIGSILEFSIDPGVKLFVEGENRTFTGTDPDSTGFTNVQTTVFPISMTNLSNVKFRLDFSESAPIPEPGVWAMMISGFGLIGLRLRRRRAIAAQ